MKHTDNPEPKPNSQTTATPPAARPDKASYRSPSEANEAHRLRFVLVVVVVEENAVE